jgi:hypothetical protein
MNGRLTIPRLRAQQGSGLVGAPPRNSAAIPLQFLCDFPCNSAAISASGNPA